jgi:hypothetical protein
MTSRECISSACSEVKQCHTGTAVTPAYLTVLHGTTVYATE